jgi:hypothetical protein
MKKKVAIAAASVSSTEAFPMLGLALQQEVPTVVASMPGRKVGRSARTLALMADWRWWWLVSN